MSGQSFVEWVRSVATAAAESRADAADYVEALRIIAYECKCEVDGRPVVMEEPVGLYESQRRAVAQALVRLCQRDRMWCGATLGGLIPYPLSQGVSSWERALDSFASRKTPQLVSALLNLVLLKRHKDAHGKTAEYEENMPTAWLVAEAALTPGFCVDVTLAGRMACADALRARAKELLAEPDRLAHNPALAQKQRETNEVASLTLSKAAAMCERPDLSWDAASGETPCA